MVHVWVSQRAGFMLPDFSWFQCRSVFVLVTLRIIRAKNSYFLNITVSPKLSSTCEIFIPYWECSYPSCYSGFSYSQQKKKQELLGNGLYDPLGMHCFLKVPTFLCWQQGSLWHCTRGTFDHALFLFLLIVLLEKKHKRLYYFSWYSKSYLHRRVEEKVLDSQVPDFYFWFQVSGEKQY